MANSRNVFRNLGKSVAYTSLDVVSSLTPNTTELLRGARSGVDATRDFIRNNQTKIKTTMGQYDRSVITKKAKAFLSDAWNDVKQGNIALGDLSADSYDDWESYLDDSEGSSTISYSDQQPSDDAGTEDQKPFGQMRGGAATDYRTISGLQQLSSVLGSTQIKTTEYQTAQLTNAIFTQMASQTEHFQTMERQLDAINKNLVQLVKFQSESQGNTNQAHLQFYDQMTRWIKKQEDRQTRMAQRSYASRDNKNSKFLGESWFDTQSYKEMVKDNLDRSELGILASFAGMLNPDMISMMISGGGKFQPQKYLLQWLLKGALTKGGRRAFARGDSQINTITKSLLTELGGYQYKMNSGSLKDAVLGVLGSIFGIDPSSKRTLQFANYKRGEMSWNGDAQKALVTVIPKELAEIKAAITKQPVRYFDSATGRFQSVDEIKRRAKNKMQDAVEAPFANIFNKTYSTNPDDARDIRLWNSMDEKTQRKISQIAQTAVYSNEGMTRESRTQLDKLMREAIRQANSANGDEVEIRKTAADTQRMVMELQKAVNIARANSVAAIESLQSTDSAITQYAMDLTDEYGNLSLENFQRQFDITPIDLRESNGGAYTQSGKRKERMSEEERARTEQAEGLNKRIIDYLQNPPDANDKSVRAQAHRAASAVYKFYRGGNNRYSQDVEYAIDSIFGAAYNATMINKESNAPIALSETMSTEERDELIREAAEAAAPHIPQTQEVQQTVEATAAPTRTPAPATTSRSVADQAEAESPREEPETRGVGNADYTRATAEQTPEQQTAEATERTSDTVEAALDPKKGFIGKFFNSPAIKKLTEWFGKTSPGKALHGKLDNAKDWFMDLIFGEDNSVKTQLRGIGAKVANMIGFTTDRNGEVEEGAEERPKKSILKSLTEAVRAKAPKVLAGGVLGAGAAMASGGHLGLIGSLFLPGGPIGGAIVGMGLSILSQTDTFKNVVFGKEGENGERSGGLISKEMQTKFKQALPTLGLGAIGGIALKFLGGATGIANTGVAKAVGFLPSMFLPGGILGAAIMGSAAAFALGNKKNQEILFGKENEDGTRSGAFLSGAYNAVTAKIKAAQKGGVKGKGKFSFSKNVLNAIKGAGIGTITGAVISKMGILGSAATLGGPIGAAIAGAAVGIAGASDKFNEYIYGSKDDEGNRKKDGLFTRLGTLLKLNIVEPAGIWFRTTAEEFMWWAKEKIEVPFRMAFGPVIDAFSTLGNTMKETATNAIEAIAEKIKGGIEGILSPIANAVMKHVINPLGRVAGTILKGGLFAAASLVGAPFQIMSTLMSPFRAKQQKKFRGFLRGNKRENLQKYWDAKAAAGETTNQTLDSLAYTLGSLPFIGNWFQGSEVIGAMAEEFSENVPGNKNFAKSLTAPRDKKRYQNARKKAGRTGKYEAQLSKLRRKWAGRDMGNQEKVLSDKEFAQRQAELATYGIKIEDQDELRQFTYNYDEWSKSPEEKAKAKNAAAQNAQTITNIRDLVSTGVDLIRNLVDINKAQLDTETGEEFDTEDLEEGESAADKIDEETAQKIQADKAKANAEAQAEVNARIKKQEDREKEHEKVTGNTSGNAHDETEEETRAEGGATATTTQNTEESSDGGILDKILTSTGARIAAITALTTVLGNTKVRSALVDLIGNALGAITSNLPKTTVETTTGALGLTEGNGSRVSGYDENGNAQTVTNTSLLQKIATAALNPSQAASGLKAVGKVGGTILKLVPGSKTASKLWSKAGAAVATSVDTGVIGKALTLIKGLLEKAAKTKLGSKAAAAISKVSGMFDDVLKVIASKNTKFASYLAEKCPALEAALTRMGIMTSTGISPAALINTAVAAYSALNGAINAESLFKVDSSAVDGKMRLISAVLNGVMGYNGAAAVIGILSEIVDYICGYDFVQSIAVSMYHVIAGKDDEAKLDQAIANFKTETENYNEANGTTLSTSGYNDLKNKSLLGSAWNWIKNLFGKGDTTDYSQYEVSTSGYGTGSSGAVGYGPGMQNDPRWANMPIGKFPNGKTSTMATGGCGPTALANAAQAMGMGLTPAEAGQYAMQNGYISQGGASEGLFDRGAQGLGLSTSRVNTSQDIANSLKSGNPVILAGKTAGYGKTPYTKAGHIVTATGLDSSGNVIVQDPMRGTGKYKLSDLKGNMTGGWSIGRGAAGYGLLDSIFGSAFSTLASSATSYIMDKLGIAEDASDGTDENGDPVTSSSGYKTLTDAEDKAQKQKIWNYLISQGYSKPAAAGIMGCWERESTNRPDRIEGDYLGSYPGFSNVTADARSLDNYTKNVLFPAYEKSNVSINQKAYLGDDGHYYPGFGLAQWTGPRAYKLLKWAQYYDKNWTDLNTQLGYANTEMKDRDLASAMKGVKNASAAARVALDNYEMYKGFAAKNPTELKYRQDYANTIYNTFASDTRRSSNKTAGNGRGAAGYGVFDSIGSMLSGAVSSIYSSLGLSQDDDTTSTTTTGDDTDTTYTASATASADQNAVVSKMASKIGKLRYSLKSSEQDPDQGVASCASTVGWAYKKALGVNNMSAGSTQQAKDNRFTTIWTNNGSNKLDLSQLQPGDILYQNWDRASNDGTMQHTEMYAGNGEDLSHGGNPTPGPTYKTLNSYRKAHTMMVRRYKGFMNTGDDTTSGYGYGCFDLNSTGQKIQSGPAGYGDGTTVTTVANNHGVETRLDTIIGYMKTIASQATKTTPASTSYNINYGEGDKTVNNKPTVVVNQTQTRRLGEKDSSNEYLRAQHRKIASAAHA